MSGFTVYQRSVRPHGCGKAYMLRDSEGRDWFVNCGVTMPLDHKTAEHLRREFPWTAPSRVMALRKTVGVGDRLGLGQDGILEAFAGTDAVPVLAQQSSRELTLTGRSPEEVLDEATFAVFREGYMGPWGADADRLQSFSAIEAALQAGYTLLSLDCSPLLGQGEAPTEEQTELYLGHTYSVGGAQVSFDRLTLEDCCREYGQALTLITEVYYSYVQRGGADLEVMLNEAKTPTTAAGHWFLASELSRRGVVIQALAPCLDGETSPAAPWEGDEAALRQELRTHSAIAGSFGYKLSFHNGENKGDILSAFSELTGDRLHVKLSGLCWLEALRHIARKQPTLFRLCYGLSLTALPVARQLYPLPLNEGVLPSLDGMADSALPALFSDPQVRQLLHITYGQLLHSRLKDKVLDALGPELSELQALVKGQVAGHLARLG